GVSYRLNLLSCHKTISVSIGASLDLWGPPTGGVVHVHLVTVTFSVRFGSDGASQNDKPLEWSDFKTLLPPPKSVCSVAPKGALAGAMDSAASTSQKRWIVRPRGFGFATQSAIPSGTIPIRPMNKAAVTSTHDVKISKGSPDADPIDVSRWSFKQR